MTMLDLTPDLCDEHSLQVRHILLNWQHIGGKPVFWGEVITVRCFEDNSRVKELLATPGKGRVLVVDGGASLRRALIGDLIAHSAIQNGWSGMVVAGAVRDVGTINNMAIGIKALGVCPVKTERRGLGDVDCDIELGGIVIASGDYVYADLNGVITSQHALTLPSYPINE
jgi:regulator of ribonuclease activity A